MDVDYDNGHMTGVHMQHMMADKTRCSAVGSIGTSSNATRREYGHSQPTSSSATRHERLLDDCIQKYIHEHKYMVTETIGPQRVKSLIKACFTTCNKVSQDPTLLNAVRTPEINNKHAKRQGAKAVKKLERIHSSGNLSPTEATGFRALSARANYLAQDRPDLAFSTKELCREFAVPNAASFMKLKRVVRYLMGLPRLVYRYAWQDKQSHLDIFTDSDVAGCQTSRRSTSGV